MKMRISLWATCVFLALAVSPLLADTYTYTGNTFTQVYGTEGYTTSDFVKGTIETATPLLPGQTYGFSSLPAFSFTDGVLTIDQTNATFNLFSLALDNNGTIYSWGIDLGSASGFIGSCAGTGPPITCVDGNADFGYFYASQSGGNVFNNPGQWTAGTVPEPSSVWLLGVGALALLGKMARG